MSKITREGRMNMGGSICLLMLHRPFYPESSAKRGAEAPILLQVPGGLGPGR